MKPPLIAFFAALLIAADAQAQTVTTNTFNRLVNAAIPDDNPNGLASSINVSGVNGAIAGISVTLDIAGGYNGDLYGFLVNSNGGAFSVLLNRVGVQSGNAFGYSDSGFHVTLSDTAMNNLHFYQNGSYTLDTSGALTGIWGADGRAIDPAANPAILGSASPTATLSQFVGTNPNGEWTLFLEDSSGGFQSALQDWQLQIEAVPEPTGSRLMVVSATLAAIYFFRRNQRRKFPPAH
jgi:subtilisin-like proprotein convertase family protein